MAKQQNKTQTENIAIKLLVSGKKLIGGGKLNKKVAFGAILILGLGVWYINSQNIKKAKSNSAPKSTSIAVGKQYDFQALNNQGKDTNYKIKLKITNAEKTNQVLVKDQAYTAKNNKTFLIVNLELKNDATTQLNILPGDLLRLSYGEEDGNKFAPDLHNNLVPVAAISTKNDRIGYVVPENIKDFVLYVGELDGKKETVNLNFPY